MADSATLTVCDETSCNTTGGKLSKREKFQAKKNYRKARNALTRQAPPKAPPKVFTPVEKKCDTCSAIFMANDMWTHNCECCVDLHKFRDSIFSSSRLHTPTVLDTYPQYVIAITYAITSSRHDGYCSDHNDSDITVTNSEVKCTLPLFKEFKKTDIASDNTITNTALLNKFYIPRNVYKCNCSHGEQNYKVLSAKVVKKADKILLDD